jgi:pyridoxamine 5'-phosphate oxidase
MKTRAAKRSIDLKDLHRNPLMEFQKWFEMAVKAGEKHPDAMTLATSSTLGRPSARIVLYKGLSHGAFRIFTNLESRKALELSSNPYAALGFHWKVLDRQLRVEGRIHPMSRVEAKKYFHSRPRTSQLGAWASKQSTVIASRETLLARLQHYELLFQGRDVPLPEHWGGFLLVPESIEFWIDGEFRLHDRFLYTRRMTKTGRAGSWARTRLSP